MAGLVAGPGIGPYNAAKYGVVAISETLAAELASEGARVGVSVLCPGLVRTTSACSAYPGAQLRLVEAVQRGSALVR